MKSYERFIKHYEILDNLLLQVAKGCQDTGKIYFMLLMDV